jgi:hypothetical protein
VVNDTGDDWELIYENATGQGWSELWVQDGPSTVRAEQGGLLFHADARQHDVLWFRPVIEGDLRIEYDFLPYESPGGTAILFIQATGDGQGVYEEDILAWRQERSGGEYALYKDHMNYASVSYTNPQDEVRFRQGPGFDLLERYEGAQEIFERGSMHGIVTTKVGRQVTFQVSNHNAGKSRTYRASLSRRPAVTTGRIGLRLMNGRKARFSDFNVYMRSSL